MHHEEGEDNRPASCAGEREGGFAPRMSRADDDGIVCSFGKSLHNLSKSPARGPLSLF